MLPNPGLRTGSEAHLSELVFDEIAQELGFSGRDAAFAQVNGEGGEPGFAGGTIMEMGREAFFHVVHVADAIKDSDRAGEGSFFEFGLQIGH